MTQAFSHPRYGPLPDVLPIFPLAGVLLLPRGSLPLNIFEERYLAMINDALKTDHRMIGMIQPTGADDADTAAAPDRTGPTVYPLGCAGRIVGFQEQGDGRFLITLHGVCRFNIEEELDMVHGYRQVRPGFALFELDMDEDYIRGEVDRDSLFAALGTYFKTNNIDPNWKSIEAMGDRMLVTSLAMGCPFNPSEKQALLEADALPDRADVLTALLKMADATRSDDSTRH
jgi:Lon protease-like protein